MGATSRSTGSSAESSARSFDRADLGDVIAKLARGLAEARIAELSQVHDRSPRL